MKAVSRKIRAMRDGIQLSEAITWHGPVIFRRACWDGPEGIVLEASNSAPLQLGHRHKRTRFPQPFRFVCRSRPVMRNGKGRLRPKTHLLFR